MPFGFSTKVWQEALEKSRQSTEFIEEQKSVDSTKDTVEQFSTGAIRSKRMPRYDLIPKVALDRLAERFTGELDSTGIPTGGALKYGESNWEKGLPTSDVINHAINHLLNYANSFRLCLEDSKDMDEVVKSMKEAMALDDDLAGAMWGICVLMYQESSGMMYHDDKYKNSNFEENKKIGLEEITKWTPNALCKCPQCMGEDEISD